MERWLAPVAAERCAVACALVCCASSRDGITEGLEGRL